MQPFTSVLKAAVSLTLLELTWNFAEVHFCFFCCFFFGGVFRFTEVLLCLSCYYRLTSVAFSVRTTLIWSSALNFRPAHYQQTEEQVKVDD